MHFKNYASGLISLGGHAAIALALGPNYYVLIRWGRQKSTITRYKREWYFCSFYNQVQEKILLWLDPFFNHLTQ